MGARPVYNSRVSARSRPTIALLAWPLLTLAVSAQVPTAPSDTPHRESSIAGRVAEPDGIPAPDALVFAAVRRDGGHTILRNTQTTTAWDGRYRITGLPPGKYLVVVLPDPSAHPERFRANVERRAPEASSSTRPHFDPTFFPGVTDVAAAADITVLDGIAVDGIDVWLTPGQRFSISGRVRWPENTAVENIAIEYANLSAHRSGLWTVPEPGDVFLINGVPQGTVVLLARADSTRGPLAGLVTTEVSASSVEDVELRLTPPGVVSGRIVYESSVPASSRAKVIALRQRLLPVSPLYPTPESSVDADGRFRIDNALGEYDVDVRGLPADLRVKTVLRKGRRLSDDRVSVRAGEVIAGIEVVIGK
jgi:hypothetical protein